jgi:hypothetical protein
VGIANSVTVLAQSAAMADVAATLIANAVDLRDHPNVLRAAATVMQDDSDLGQRLVTVDVDLLHAQDVTCALNAGLLRADAFRQRGWIRAAAISLQDQQRLAKDFQLTLHEESRNA